MTPDRGLPSEYLPARAEARPMPVLIRVPALGQGPHARPRRRPSRVAAPPRRRRLRREVRVAGLGLLLGLPLAYLALAMASGRIAVEAAEPPDSPRAVVAEAADDPSRPDLEAAPAPGWEPAPAVILSVDFLPAEEHEDLAHAGR